MLILVVLSIALMILDKRVAGTAQIRAVLSMPLAPIQYAVSYPIQMIDKLSNLVSTHDSLVKENLDLKAEQLLLKSQVQRLLAIESENNQLKALLSTSATVQGKVLVAQIMAVDSDPFVNQVTVDKGSHEGVFVGQPVLDANGVMGQIIQVGPLTSRVLLVNDSHSGVPVQNMRNGIRAVAVGDRFSGGLRLANVPQTADIKPNDVLLTSGLGDHYPVGYPLGRVLSVVKDPGLQFATILVEPSAHLDRSRQVLLVWPAKEAFVKPTSAIAGAASATMPFNAPLMLKTTANMALVKSVPLATTAAVKPSGSSTRPQEVAQKPQVAKPPLATASVAKPSTTSTISATDPASVEEDSVAQ